MKRPKISEMNPLQLVRFRLLQARRGAQRTLNVVRCIDLQKISAKDREGLEQNVQLCRSIIKVTKPSWVASANLNEASSVLAYFAGKAQ